MDIHAIVDFLVFKNFLATNVEGGRLLGMWRVGGSQRSALSGRGESYRTSH